MTFFVFITLQELATVQGVPLEIAYVVKNSELKRNFYLGQKLTCLNSIILIWDCVARVG